MIFGFTSTQNPARGFTIISKKYGMIDLYEERVSPSLLKRDIQITEFPEILMPYLGLSFPVATLTDLSTMIEKIYED